MTTVDWGKLIASAVLGAMIGLGSSYIALNAKAGEWASDKPFVMSMLAELSADMKAVLQKLSGIEGELRRERR